MAGGVPAGFCVGVVAVGVFGGGVFDGGGDGDEVGVRVGSLVGRGVAVLVGSVVAPAVAAAVGFGVAAPSPLFARISATAAPAPRARRTKPTTRATAAPLTPPPDAGAGAPRKLSRRTRVVGLRPRPPAGGVSGRGARPGGEMIGAAALGRAAGIARRAPANWPAL